MCDYPRDDVLEVGNVLSFAGVTGHTVVDKYDRGDGVLNVDIMEYRPSKRFSLVLSISTLEHIGWDEDPREPEKASDTMRLMCDMGDSVLITIPVGWHRQLERKFLEGPLDSMSSRSRLRGSEGGNRVRRWDSTPSSTEGRLAGQCDLDRFEDSFHSLNEELNRAGRARRIARRHHARSRHTEDRDAEESIVLREPDVAGLPGAVSTLPDLRIAGGGRDWNSHQERLAVAGDGPAKLQSVHFALENQRSPRGLRWCVALDDKPRLYQVPPRARWPRSPHLST